VSAWDTSLPSPVRALHALEFDYADGDGIDFEPYGAFLSSSETSNWFKAWTGNAEVDGAEFRVFGQDGSGGYAAFWLVAAGRDVLQQPVIFLGSEGEKGVVAVNYDEYLWLLAGGIGPYEAVAYANELNGQPNLSFKRFAQKHASIDELSPAQVVAKGNSAYPGFRTWIESLCR
jgi:hypothetical protein